MQIYGIVISKKKKKEAVFAQFYALSKKQEKDKKKFGKCKFFFVLKYARQRQHLLTVLTVVWNV